MFIQKICDSVRVLCCNTRNVTVYTRHKQFFRWRQFFPGGSGWMSEENDGGPVCPFLSLGSSIPSPVFCLVDEEIGERRR